MNDRIWISLNEEWGSSYIETDWRTIHLHPRWIYILAMPSQARFQICEDARIYANFCQFNTKYGTALMLEFRIDYEKISTIKRQVNWNTPREWKTLWHEACQKGELDDD